MISKLALLLTTVFVGLNVAAVPTTDSKENVLVQEVKSLETISENNYDDSYLGTIFYLPIDENEIPHNIDGISRLTETNEIQEVDVKGRVLGKYFYEVKEGVIGEGYLIGTTYTTNENLNIMIQNTKDEIVNGIIQRDYQNTNSRSVASMAIGDSWTSTTSKKFTWSLDYDGVHYGDAAEWYSNFIIVTNNYRYRLMAHETYISPNNNKTDDFRASRLIYNFKPNSQQVQLRDYQPKSKNPSMTITYGSDLSAEIGSDSSAKIGASISSSYSTILESPKVYDKGNMAKDEVNIEFEYVNPWTENNPWYSYNINQSMQTAIYIVRENRSNKTSYSMSDNRIIQMIQDNFWPWKDKTINFEFNIANTISYAAYDYV
ncbi:MAG: hypothetical protein K2L12_07560 [Clostridia bacterium]|nr:hypothetical protein [Clostridia bacterium]